MKILATVFLIGILASCASTSAFMIDTKTEEGPLRVIPTVEPSADLGALLNSLRERNKLLPISENMRLRNAARTQALVMSASGLLSHQGKDGAGVGIRVARHGYNWCVIAENIAFGHQSEEAVMMSWTQSERHLQNMLIPNVTEYGVARTPDDYWVLILGASDC